MIRFAFFDPFFDALDVNEGIKFDTEYKGWVICMTIPTTTILW